MRHEALANERSSIQPWDFDLNGTWDSTRFTDWQKELIGRTAQYTDVQASVTGGNSTTQYLVSTGYHKETTVFPGNLNDQRGSVHLNINSATPNQRFKIHVSLNYMADKNKLINDDLTKFAVQLAPVAPPLYNIDGSLNLWAENSSGNSTWSNPLIYLERKI